MTELLLIGAGVMGAPYIDAAHRLGVRVRLVETPANLATLSARVERTVPCPGTREEDWVEAAAQAAVEDKPLGVLAFTEWNVLAAAFVQDELGLPGPSLHAAVLSRDKALQRSRLGARGVPQPEFLVTDSPATAVEWVAPRLPVVLKPPSGAGSAGVEYIADLDAFRAAADRRATEGRILIERAVSGPEYSWEGLVRNGEIVFGTMTEKETTGPPGFVEVAHRAGHVFPPPVDRQVAAFVRLVLAAMRVGTCLVHLEFRVSPSGPVLMEVAVRTPGDYIMDAVSLTYGIDLYEAVVRLALGLEVPPIDPQPVAYAACWWLLAPPGPVVEVSGLDEVRDHPAVVRADVTFRPGDVVPPLRSSAERAGYVLLTAPDPSAREAAIADTRGRLRIVTDAR